MEISQEALTLFQLTNLIRETIEDKLSKTYLVIAEIQSIMQNRTGHCYLELVEKSQTDDKIISQVRANIWASQWRIIKPYFETATGRAMEAGLKILVKVRVTFHELYGLSLNVLDILPEYTLGELEMQRKLTIKQLQDDGVFDMNRELQLPMLVQKIAVISSAGAAGYGDFVNQLKNNSFGYKFYTSLFEAVMQGNTAEPSIIEQLNKILQFTDFFDCVVIIRGGGSKTDLACFDSLRLCQNICQFPLPVITGIGHDRDESVADLVANTHLKTPTAVAQFLIDRANACDTILSEKIVTIKQSVRDVLTNHEKLNHEIVVNLISVLKNFYPLKTSQLENKRNSIINNLRITEKNIQTSNNQTITNIINLLKTRILEKTYTLDSVKMKIDLNSPKQILKKGYTFTKINGKAAKSVSEIHEGQEITTFFYDGQVSSVVNKISK